MHLNSKPEWKPVCRILISTRLLLPFYGFKGIMREISAIVTCFPVFSFDVESMKK